MKRTTLCLTLVLGLILPVRADEAADLDKQVEVIDQTDQQAAQPDQPLGEVSRKTGVPEKQLKEQKAKTKLNSGGLYIANTLAAKTGKSFDEIMAQKNSGKGWGQIAKENNVKLGPLMKDAKKLEKDQRAAQKKAGKAPKDASAGKSTGKPEDKSGKPQDKSGKPEEQPKGNPNAGSGKKK
jgi:hypothetical protein